MNIPNGRMGNLSVLFMDKKNVMGCAYARPFFFASGATPSIEEEDIPNQYIIGGKSHGK